MNVDTTYHIQLTKDEAEIWDTVIGRLSDKYMKENIRLTEEQIEKLHNMYINTEEE